MAQSSAFTPMFCKVSNLWTSALLQASFAKRTLQNWAGTRILPGVEVHICVICSMIPVTETIRATTLHQPAENPQHSDTSGE